HARPVGMLEDVAEYAESEEQNDVAIGEARHRDAHEHHRDDQWENQRPPNETEQYQPALQDEDEDSSQNVGDDDHPHHHEGNIELLRDHGGPRTKPDHEKYAEEDCHRGVAGNAEGNCGDEGARLLGRRSGLRRDDPAYVAL